MSRKLKRVIGEGGSETEWTRSSGKASVRVDGEVSHGAERS